MILLQLGRAKLNCIRKTITSRIWIESTVCRRSSSGKYSKESQRWASSRRFKVQWETYCEPEHFKDRIIFMPMYNDIAWREEGNTERCEYNSQTVAELARKFPRGHWSFLGPGSERKWYATFTDKPDGCWDKIAENMDDEFLIFQSSNISCLQCFWERRIEKQSSWQEVFQR